MCRKCYKFDTLAHGIFWTLLVTCARSDRLAWCAHFYFSNLQFTIVKFSSFCFLNTIDDVNRVFVLTQNQLRMTERMKSNRRFSNRNLVNLNIKGSEWTVNLYNLYFTVQQSTSSRVYFIAYTILNYLLHVQCTYNSTAGKIEILPRVTHCTSRNIEQKQKVCVSVCVNKTEISYGNSSW